MNVAIGLSGQIGSGKSTISRNLAQAMKCKQASFGEYVRWLARERGLFLDRRTLQDLGQDMLELIGAEQFCIDMLQQQVPHFVPGERLVVDGVRHLEVAEALSRMLRPSVFLLVYMKVDERVRSQRIASRDMSVATAGHDLVSAIEMFDRHPSEQDVRQGLRAHADLTLVATRPSTELVRAVLEFVQSENSLRSQAK